VAKRIFQLAKELQVKSTAVVEKCHAEGIDIKNHMSTLSAGLEATIREWFTSGDNATTIETTARVDLEKVKSKKPRSRKKKVEVEDEPESITAVGVAVIEAPSETESQEETAATIEAQVVSVPKKAKTSTPKRKSPKEIKVGAEDTKAEAATEKPKKTTDEEQTGEESAEASPDEPERKGPLIIDTIKPTKQMEPAAPVPFVPAPAVLQGPKVLRTVPMEIMSTRPIPRKPRKSTAVAETKTSTTDTTRGGDTTAGGRRRQRKQRGTEPETTADKGAQRAKPKTQQRRAGRKYAPEYVAPHERGNQDLLERQQRLAKASGTMLHRRERQLAQKGTAGGAPGVLEPLRIEKAVVQEPITVKKLSAAIGIRTSEIIGKLMGMGVMATINEVLEAEAAMTVAMDFGVDLTVEEITLLWDKLKTDFDQETTQRTQVSRPPIVAFLGHVDHGKTSLLDRIRKASVTSGEAGGITQHIGSYLYTDGKRQITFLDTPGHKAFTQMRARGANITDVVVLVVAADDGVMPQTEEAINHAKAAGVPIVVALNKIDLPNMDINRILGQLSEHELVPAEWGGDTEIVRTSAASGEGIEDLLDHLEYIAELKHLTAATEGPATGWVVEAEMTVQQGAVATLLVKSGTLKPGNIIVSGSSYGRVRTIIDTAGATLTEAGPSTPVEITGLSEVPIAGDRFFVPGTISQAAEIAEEQRSRRREKALLHRRQITLDNLFSEIAAGELKELNVIVRADVQGSVDVLRNTIMEMNTSEVAVRILHAAVGGITESDVLLAQASNAIIIGFQVVADEHARNLAEKEGVEIRLYRVIYQISEDMKKALEGMLKPRIEEKPLGRAEVRQVFRVSRVGAIAGCLVTEGKIQRSARLRIIRDSVVIRDNNPIESLRRIKDDASEVRSGLECGIKLEKFDDLKNGDVLEAYELIEISRTLDSVE
jgi:translation initiation factor IF-2